MLINGDTKKDSKKESFFYVNYLKLLYNYDRIKLYNMNTTRYVYEAWHNGTS